VDNIPGPSYQKEWKGTQGGDEGNGEARVNGRVRRDGKGEDEGQRGNGSRKNREWKMGIPMR
jgi:hypothetical protein